MQLAKIYSLTSGQRLKKPKIYEEFFSIPFENYITFSSTSKNSKTYDLWDNVVGLLKPILDKYNIGIVQIGGKDDKKVSLCYDLCGKTSLNQTFYLIKRARLHLGVDSFGCHTAGIFGVPLVALYSNNYSKNVGPFWANKEKTILLEPNRGTNKPSFSFEENPKTINEILPEDIVKNTCKLLNIESDFNFPYKTLYFGPQYLCRWIENIPNQVVDLKSLGTDTVVMRMDVIFDETNLYNQLLCSNVVIVTNRPINLELITNFRGKIKEFIYTIDEYHNPSFVEYVQKMGIKTHLQSWLSEDQLNDIKLSYLDIGIINKREVSTPQTIKELKNKEPNKLYYQSNKFILSKSKIYQSIAAHIHEKPLPSFGMHIQPIIDDTEFWKEMNHFWILEKI